MLLDRRVSRFDPWPDPGFCTALSDELRKNFIKLYATENTDCWKSDSLTVRFRAGFQLFDEPSRPKAALLNVSFDHIR
jgi:hypothetical protein